MNIERGQMDNDIFYQPEDGFWEGIDKLSFEAKHLEPEWPTPSNLFIQRMASLIKVGSGNHNLGQADFKDLIGAMIMGNPRLAYRFLVVPMGKNAVKLSIGLAGQSTACIPPILAENACSLNLAIQWMARRQDHFWLSCAAGGSYWVHKQ
jgi:hypothetical protein